MKVRPTKFQEEEREATAIEKSIKLMIKKHGYGLVRYVASRIFEKIVAEEKLLKTIQEKEEELEELRKQKP